MMAIQNKTKTGRTKPTKTADERYYLRLYIAGQTPKAAAALKNLKSFCEVQLQGKYSIEVIDLLKNPRQGRKDQILAIPTLIRKSPLPQRMVIGDLSNTERLIAGLDLE